jgi:hypothetical protein
MADNDEKSKQEKFANFLKIAKAAYVYGGLFGARIAQIGIFDKRGSSIEEYERSFDYRLYKTRKDYPALAKRSVLHFPSGENTLTGYLYRVASPKGLVLAVHGFASLADGDGCAYQDYFVRHGYDVFAIDLTASGRSEGSSTIGLHQSAYDVAAAEKAIHANKSLAALPLFLIGHSWGAFGVSASLNFDQSPRAVCEMSGYYQPDIAMASLVRQHAGPFADATKWQMDDALKERAGDDAFLSALKGMSKAKKTHLILVHGDQDDVIDFKDASIFAQSGVIKNTHVLKLLQKGKKHDGVWFTAKAGVYAAQMKQAAKELLDQYKTWGDVPSETLAAFNALVDPEKASELDTALLDAIEAEFSRCR